MLEASEHAALVLRTREQMELAEEAGLASFASKSGQSRGRRFPTEPHPYRTEYQKDRDRIIHTTAFRRLQYKTQVFVNYEGDYYRTRLTHTNEAAQIARTITRALGANVDLAEAIALAHDLGHSAFGHSGESTLDRLMLERMGRDPFDPANKGQGFNHTVQSLRVVEELEKRWSQYDGLNLTWETREGIAKHNTEYDKVPPEWLAPYEPELRPSIEAQVVNYADELTYSAHDLDDGLRSGMLRMDMPELAQTRLWRLAADAAGVGAHPGGDAEVGRHKVIRSLIDLMITDLVFASADRIGRVQPASPDDARRHPVALVRPSDEMLELQHELKEFLFAHLYRHYRVVRMFRKAERVLEAMFETFEDDYRQLPNRPRARILAAQPDVLPGGPLTPEAYRVIADYLAGMTDRYALQEHSRLFEMQPPRDEVNDA
ncbi:MAG: deoxyguanosinetriphosphate triphosphohydrolase [Anaerolineae bacterium]